ncbi:MAG: GTPase domain-containing protein [Gloeomargarita sp. DG_1_5_bins_55]
MEQTAFWQAITTQSLAHWQRYQPWLGDESSLSPSHCLSIVIVGVPGVGKTSLLRHLIHPVPVVAGTTAWPMSILTPDPPLLWTDTPGWSSEQATVIQTALAQADVCFWVVPHLETAPSELALTLKSWGRPVVRVVNRPGGEPMPFPPAQGNIIATVAVRLAPHRQAVRSEWPDGRVAWDTVDLPVDVTAVQTVLRHLLDQELPIRCVNRLTRMAIQERQWASKQGQTPLPWTPVLAKSLLLTFSPAAWVSVLLSLGTDLCTLVWLSRRLHLPITRRGIQRVLTALCVSSGSVGLLGLSQGWWETGMLGLWGGLTSYGFQRIARTYLQQGITWAADGPAYLLQQIYTRLTPGSWLHTWVEHLLQGLPDR